MQTDDGTIDLQVTYDTKCFYCRLQGNRTSGARLLYHIGTVHTGIARCKCQYDFELYGTPTTRTAKACLSYVAL